MKAIQNVFFNFLKALVAAMGFVSIVIFTGSGTMCYFKTITGLPCPGCGLTRAFISLYKGSIKDAFMFHPLWFLIPAIAGVIIFKDFLYLARKAYNSKIFWCSALLIFMVCYSIRMIILFPYLEPMTYNKNSLFYLVYKLILSLFA